MIKTSDGFKVPEIEQENAEAIEHNTKLDAEKFNKLKPDEQIKKVIQQNNEVATKKKKKIFTSLFIGEKDMYEQIYDLKTNTSKFLHYNDEDGTIIEVKSFNINGIEYFPNEGEELQKKAIYLPEKAEEYGTDEELEKEIKTFINKWLDISEDFLQFSTWNVKRSWVYERFHTINYLRALGDTGQGKSRFLDTIGWIHYKPIATSGATTAAPVFRVIDKWRGTMIFDECDLKITEETADIIKIINMGYERGKHVMRCDQNDATKIMFFDPFCPKIIATRKPFEDKAVESRCITQVMMGTRRKNIEFTLTNDFFEEQKNLRNKLLMWRFKNFFKIDPTKTYDIKFDNLEPRVQQIVSSYASLFGQNPVQMQRFKSFIIEYQNELIDERQNSWEGQIIIGIHSLIEKGVFAISAQDIIEESGLTNNHGQPLKPRALVNVIKELGFGKSVIKRVGEFTKRCIPLDQDQLDNLFARYGVTKVTVAMGTGDEEKHLDCEEEGGLRSIVTNVTSLQSKQEYDIVTTETTVTDSLSDDDFRKGIFSDDEISIYIKNNQGICSLDIQKHFDITYDRLVNMRNKGLIFEKSPDKWDAI